MTEEDTTQQQLSPDDDLKDTVLRFIKQSPPDEENEVYHSLETIIGDTGDISQFKEENFRALHLDTFHIVTIPGTSDHMLITPYAELDENHYLDPRTKQVITYEHASNTASDVVPYDVEEDPNEPVRKAVEDAVSAYVAKDYADAVCEVYITTNNSGAPAIAVCINSTQAKSAAMWSGRWKSCWIIDIQDGKCPINGQAQVDAHFYEAGNVSFKSSRDYQGSATLSDPKSYATAIATFIQTKDRELNKEIDESFHRLSEDAFKALRRKLPVTRTKIDWDNFALQGSIGKAN